MKVVLDGPVAAHGVGEGVGPKDPRRDVGAPLELNLFAALSPALDHCDGGELGEAECARIGALGGHPVDLVGDRVGSDFQPAMALVDSLRLLDRVGRCGIEIAFNFGMKGRLVVLHSQKVVGFGIEDALSDVRIASHGIDGDQGAGEVDALSTSAGMAVISLDFSSVAC